VRIMAGYYLHDRRVCSEGILCCGHDGRANIFIFYSSCWSYIGRQGGAQRLVLGRGCEKFGTIVHETGHALGLWHEQVRIFYIYQWNGPDFLEHCQ
jgi:hypothetical protein